MIIRAQAEALLTLAESLEACERLGIEVRESTDGMCIIANGECYDSDLYSRLNGMSIRLAVNALIQKQET
jgi:5-enolpyruvylshikimate-3-phosphate synthase